MWHIFVGMLIFKYIEYSVEHNKRDHGFDGGTSF